MHGDAGDAGDVSPHAATVPLAGDEGRTTEGLARSEERVAPQTSRVSLAEMERLLRARDDVQPPPPGDQGTAPAPHSSAATRPDAPAPDFDEELTITVPRPPQTRETGDFEATADFEATLPADLEATRPAPPTHTRPPHATRDAPAHGDDSEDDAAPPGAWPYGDAAARAGRPRAAAEDSDAAAVGDSQATFGGARGARAGGAAGARHTPPGRTWPLVVIVCAAVAVLAGGAWLAFKVLRRPSVTEVPTQQPSAPPVTADARQQFEGKLAEAEALLAGGDMEGALARLREANALDPANTRARRRLAELLLSTGARAEAIEELRAVVRNAPDDPAALRQLATAQAAEGLHRDAAESFRRLFALDGGGAADPADLLSYADALRLSGRAEESRAVYERVASGAPAELASAARQRLAELARAEPTPAPTQQAGAHPGEESARADETASAGQPAAQPSPAPPTPAPPQPTPAPARPTAGSPAEHYGRGVQLWPSNRGAALAEFRTAASGGNVDAHYYLGLAFVEGRSLSSLKRAEVVAALQHFQLAQRGRHAAQARGHAQQLEKEFDRLRRQ